MEEEKLRSLVKMAASRVIKLAELSILEYETSIERRRKMLEDGTCPANDKHAIEVSSDELNTIKTAKNAVDLLKEYHGV